jgi:hypothetical protein
MLYTYSTVRLCKPALSLSEESFMSARHGLLILTCIVLSACASKFPSPKWAVHSESSPNGVESLTNTPSHDNIRIGNGNRCNNPNCIVEVRVNSITGNVNSANSINQTIFGTVVTKTGPGTIVLNYVGN